MKRNNCAVRFELIVFVGGQGRIIIQRINRNYFYRYIYRTMSLFYTDKEEIISYRSREWKNKIKQGRRGESWKRVASLSLDGGKQRSPSSFSLVAYKRVQYCKTATNPLTKWHLYAITNNWWLVEAQSLVNLIRTKNAIGDVAHEGWLVPLADNTTFSSNIFKMRYTPFVFHPSFFFLSLIYQSYFNVNFLSHFNPIRWNGYTRKKSKRNVTRANYRIYKLKIHRVG